MSRTIVNEGMLFVWCILGGVLFSLLYDLFRLFRKLIKHGRIWIDLEDILYWSICFVCSFCFLYYVNYGVIRFFCVLGAAIGMTIYLIIKNWLTKIGKQFTINLRKHVNSKGEMDLAKGRET